MPPTPPPAVLEPGRGPVVWRWGHLWVFGFAAFAIPEIIDGMLSTGLSQSTLIDRSMMLAILGYIFGAVILRALVRDQQNGDWSTVGIGRFDARELAWGAGFGLLLLLAFVPIGLLLNDGRFGLDPVVKLIVGGASGAGLFLVAIVFVIGAPVIEEIYFRGMLFQKLGRRSVWVAVIVSSVLFTLAHGALLIPAILLLGFGLGLMRTRRTLWFTMGGHASWNLAITVIAMTTLFGGGVTFTPAGADYSVDYPSTWEASDEARQAFGPQVDLAIGSARGSVAMFTTEPTEERSAEATLTGLVAVIDEGLEQAGAMEMMEKTGIMPTDVDFAPIGAEGYEMGYISTGPTEEQPHFSTLVVVQKPGDGSALFAEFRCIRSICMDDVDDFEGMLASIQWGAP